MGTSTRKLEVVIAGDARGALRAFGDVDARSGRLGRSVGTGLRLGAAGFSALAIGGAAAGVALFRVGQDFDSAFDTIRISTGATGARLEGLKDDFRGVVADVPASFEDASAAISGLNTRLGLSGPRLESVAEPILNLTRMTGGDLPANIQGLTRVFGDWDIGARAMPRTLDEIFRASQASGAGVESLSSNVVQFGAPLRQMGFSLEESLALFGRFEAEGVNISTVMGGMRRGLAGFAQDGEAPAEALARVSSEIQNAGSVADANRLAIEVFGSRAGPDMAAAIREGRFELGALTAEISGGRDTIAGAAADTADFGEKWQQIKNRVFLALEPVAAALFDGIGDAMTALGPIVGQVGSWLGDRLPGWIAQARAALESIRPVFDAIVAAVRRTWPDVERVITQAVTGIRSIVTDVVSTIRSLWRSFGDDILRHVRGAWGPIVQTIRGALQIIQGVVHTVTSLIRGDWGEVWNGIKSVLAGVWNVIVGTVRGAINTVRTVISVGVQAIANLWGVVWRGIQTVLRGIWSGITGVIRTGVNAARSVISGAWNAVRTATSNAWNRVRDVVRDGIDRVVDFVRGLPGRIASIARGAFDGIVSAFRGAINAIIRGWNALEFTVPEVSAFGITVGGQTIGLPDIPLLAEGGRARRGGLALVGEAGAEVVALPTGATVFPMDRLGASSANELHIHLHGPVFGANPAEVERVLVAALRSAQRKGLVTGLVAS